MVNQGLNRDSVTGALLKKFAKQDLYLNVHKLLFSEERSGPTVEF